MLRSRLLCALAALAACGPGDAAGEPAAAARAPEPARPAVVAEPASDDDTDPAAGPWFVFATELPYRAFRVTLEPGRDGEVRKGAWATFDWRTTAEAETLQRRSKPVSITATGGLTSLLLEGPSPMLTEDGRPNGQSGTWRIELRRSEQPGQPPRWSGRAVHDEDSTGPEGVAVEMERAFRRWQ
ncbi:MAG TPA: hypothetical protein VFD43_10100 [Planctomycetota bacterium]|nr:hypothetical protein [Planctomycetota bacterium]